MSPKILCYLLVIAVFSLSGGQLINNLKGRHIRVATVHLPPLMTIQHGSRGVQYSGALFEHLEWLSRRLHFKYELVQEPNNTIGTEVNGSWNGLIDQLIQHEIDLALFPLTIYYQRHRVISFSGWFAGGRNVLLTPYPTAQFSAWAVAEPFSNQVWIGWIVSLTGVTAVSGALMSLERARSRNGCNNSTRTDSWFFYIFGTIMAQGGYWRTRYKFLRILAVTWCLGAFVFVNVYCTTLTSKLATCYNAPEINSIEQLAQSSTYNIAVIKGSTAETDIKSAVPEAFQLIRNKLVNCEQCTTHFVEELGRKVLQGDFIGFQASSTSLGLIESTMRAAKGNCLLTLGYEKMYWMYSYLGIPKTSSYMEEVNRESSWAHAFGLPLKWKSFGPMDNRCLLKFNRKGFEVRSYNKPLKLRQLNLAFVILLIGHVLAATAFICERCPCRIYTSVLTTQLFRNL